MCFRREKENDINEKTRILNKTNNISNKTNNISNKTNNDLFNNYNYFNKNIGSKKNDSIIEFNGIDINKLVLEIEKYINSWFNKSKFKIMGSTIIDKQTYYILIDNITKEQIKVRYTLIDYDPMKVLIINEVIHSV